MDKILDPTILFFCLGVIAVWLRSNIEVPSNTTKFLSYYLLMSLGFKGGIALAKTQMSEQIIWTVLAGIVLAILVPLWMFFILKRKLNVENAAAISACYGSVSAVTFLTATSWLENRGLTYGGHMVALLALMESPAIIVGLILAKITNKKSNNENQIQFNLLHTLHEGFFNGSVLILVGSLIIGYVMPEQKAHEYQVFVYDIFKGFLCFFLLDLGMEAARKIKELKNDALLLSLTAIGAPLINSLIGLGVSQLLHLHPAEGFLFIILVSSASYIAVPAALKLNLPQAQPSVYLSMSLGLTFPFNILIGMHFYWWLAQTFLT